MKKIFTSFALAIAALGFTANAECYVVGEAEGAEWSPTKGAAIPETSEAGVYSGPITITGNGYFTIADALLETADWDTFNTQHRYAPEVKDTPIVIGELTPMTKGIDASWKVDAASYIFTVDFNNSTLLVTTDTGVEIINTDNTPAEYYNFQGVRVANPENGMYIVKRGNKVSKVIVK